MLPASNLHQTLLISCWRHVDFLQTSTLTSLRVKDGSGLMSVLGVTLANQFKGWRRSVVPVRLLAA